MRGLMRRLGARALLCLVIGALLTLPRRVHAQELAPLVLTESETEPGVVVYRSTAPGPRPISVVLHGMCGEPERACAHFARAIGVRNGKRCRAQPNARACRPLRIRIDAKSIHVEILRWT